MAHEEVARTGLKNLAGDLLSVVEYDAVVDPAGNGTHTTLRAAVLAAGVHSIFVKNGTTTEVNNFTIPDGTVIFGEGHQAIIGMGTFKIVVGMDNVVANLRINFTTSAGGNFIDAQASNSILTGLYLYATGTAPASDAFVANSSGTNNVLENCLVRVAGNFANSSAGIGGSGWTAIRNITFTNCSGNTNTQHFLYITGEPCVIDNVVFPFVYNDAAVFIGSIGGVKLSNLEGCGVTLSGSDYVRMDNCYAIQKLTVSSSNASVSNVHCDSLVITSDGVQLSNVYVQTGMSNVGQNTFLSNVYVFGGGPTTTTLQSVDGSYTNCLFDLLIVDTGDGNSFENCNFKNDVTVNAGADRTRFVGNKFNGNTTVQGNDCTVCNNFSASTKTITIGASANRAVVVGNSADNITDSGTGTIPDGIPLAIADINNIY